MRYTYSSMQAVKTRLEDAYNVYVAHCRGDYGDEDYCGPWEIFKDAIFEVVTSEYADDDILLNLIGKLQILVSDYFDDDYWDNWVLFDLVFIYDILYEIALKNQEIYITESIVDLCIELRKCGKLVDFYTINRMPVEAYQFYEERLFKAIVDSQCMNSTVACKMIENATVSFYEYFIDSMEPSYSLLSAYGRIFHTLYINRPIVWLMMEQIYCWVNLFADSEVTQLVMEDSARRTDDVYKCVIGVMSDMVSQDILKNCSKHHEDVIRFATAFNKSLDIPTLEELTQDTNDSVKWRAIRTLKEIDEEIEEDVEDISLREHKAKVRDVLARLNIPGYY